MGNTCCTGRLNHGPLHNEKDNIKNTSKISHKRKKSQHKSFEERRPSKQFKGKSSPKHLKTSLELKKLAKQLNQEAPKHVRFEKTESIRNANEEKFKSDPFESQEILLHYHLEEASNYRKSDQRKIIQILDNYQGELEDGEIEKLDGISDKADMKGELVTLMFTTHAIYILDREDWTNIIRRISYKSIKAVSLAEKDIAILFHIDPNDEKYDDILISSESYFDIIKAMEQLHYEITGNYISWNTVASKNELENLMNKPLAEQFSQEDKFLAKIIMKYGEIGEKKLNFQACSTIFESNDYDKYFLFTNKSVYILNHDFTLAVKLLLVNIYQIGKNSLQKSIILYSSSKSYYAKLQLMISKEIAEAAVSAGNWKIKEIDLETEP
ncbi:unnamed protein product [Blepharisma stoltei]|uniref:Uncharacterized protein n=1 Tax=Blepharisma stoltei TaxID=1481888 RepID=A0AAU9JXJ4_9CILI|nr:unnamed protein product [Blepharisma stoltei]